MDQTYTAAFKIRKAIKESMVLAGAAVALSTLGLSFLGLTTLGPNSRLEKLQRKKCEYRLIQVVNANAYSSSAESAWQKLPITVIADV